MFIGHIPAGYLLSIGLRPRLSRPGRSATRFVAIGIFGAVSPDLDLFYFYLVDHARHHHHTYFTHLPLFWLGLLAIFAAARKWRPAAAAWPGLGLIFALNGFGHVVLDSIVGDVWWLAPWVDRPYSLFSVHRRLEPYWLNFILHGSFALELALLISAIVVFRRRRRS